MPSGRRTLHAAPRDEPLKSSRIVLAMQPAEPEATVTGTFAVPVPPLPSDTVTLAVYVPLVV